jgi:hypothetical protein
MVNRLAIILAIGVYVSFSTPWIMLIFGRFSGIGFAMGCCSA